MPRTAGSRILHVPRSASETAAARRLRRVFHQRRNAETHGSWIHEDLIVYEQVKQLYTLAPLGFMATVMNAAIVLLVMKEVMAPFLIAFWISAVLAVTAARAALVFSYRHAPPSVEAAPLWERRFAWSLSAIGIAWGSFGFFPLTFSIAHQVFIVFVLGGMCAGACSTFSKTRYGYEAYAIPALAPLTVHFFLVADHFHGAMGAMMLTFLILLGRISRHNYRVNRDSLLLRFENHDIIQSLKQAKDALEELNVKLITEVRGKLEAEAELKAHRDQLEQMVHKRTAELVETNERLKNEIETRTEIGRALRESRERLVLAQRAGRVGIFDWDFVTGNVFWTAEQEELFGMPLGKHQGTYGEWATRVHPSDLCAVEQKLAALIGQRGEYFVTEYRFLRGDGVTRWMASTARITYREDGTPLRMIGTNLDVTEMKEAQEKLRAGRDAAEAGSMAKSEFLANMSHEMRTPLAGVLGMIELVLDMGIGAEERRLLEMANRSAESLLRIIEDLLDFSRLEAGVMKFEKKPFNLTVVIASAIEVVSLSARERGLHLSWVTEEGERWMEGDAGRLRQVLVNLLGNAVKFTEEGSIEVTATPLPREGEKGGHILFTVRDTGVGIAEDQLEHIFGKFTQIDTSLTKRYGGTGLGLALSRQIVEKMGGRIWAESILGVGSTFYFTVPEALAG